MRIEDFDGPRIQPGTGMAALETLQWLGLDWDGEPMVQSSDRGPYLDAMERLAREGLVYPCSLSRRDIASAASAPHEDEHETCFSASLRPQDAGESQPFQSTPGVHWRFLVSPGPELVVDELSGKHEFRPSEECGDFVAWTVRDEPAYQLAVVVDDLRQEVSDVIRGNDLLSSAARQQLIYQTLGATPPRWWHLPLVRGTDGRRLAKRHGDTRLDSYRKLGTPSDRIVGLLAYWCGLLPERQSLQAQDVLTLFDMSTLPKDDIVFTPEDDSWLRG